MIALDGRLFAQSRALPTKQAQSRMRALAPLAVVLGHLALVLLISADLSGASIATDAGSQGESGAVFLTLTGRTRPASSAQVNADPELPLRSLLDRVQDERGLSQPPKSQSRSSAPKSDLDRLFSELDRPSSDSRDAADPRDAKAEQNRASNQVANAQAGTQPDSAAASLLGQISKCWRKLPGVPRSSVALEIALDEGGRLALPPKILRPPRALVDEQRLAAEARAIAAVAACGPYMLPGIVVGGGVFQIDLRAQR